MSHDCEFVRNRIFPLEECVSLRYEDFETVPENERENAISLIAYRKREEEDKYGLDEWDALEKAIEWYRDARVKN